MAQRLRTLVCSFGGPRFDLIPSTHMVANNFCTFSSKGPGALLSLQRPCTHAEHKYKQQNIHTIKIKIDFLRKKKEGRRKEETHVYIPLGSTKKSDKGSGPHYSEGSDQNTRLNQKHCQNSNTSRLCSEGPQRHCYSIFLLFLQGRSHLNHEKEMFAQDHPEVNSLEEVVRLVKPTAIIGRKKKSCHPAQLTLSTCR